MDGLLQERPVHLRGIAVSTGDDKGEGDKHWDLPIPGAGSILGGQPKPQGPLGVQVEAPAGRSRGAGASEILHGPELRGRKLVWPRVGQNSLDVGED